MPIRFINREDNPEEFALLDELAQKAKQCDIRGHGESFVDSDGFVWCRDCDQCLLAGPDDRKERSGSR